MAEEFLSDSVESSPAGERVEQGRGERQPVKVMAIGSREGVQRVIHQLHNLGFAEAGNWSDLMREPQTGEWMSIVIQWIRLE